MFKDLKQKAKDVYIISLDGKTYLILYALYSVFVTYINELINYYKSG